MSMLLLGASRACLKLASPRTILSKPVQEPVKITFRVYTKDGRTARSGIRFRSRDKVLKETAAKPGEFAIKVGQSAVTATAVVGLGALCFYGLGLSNQVGAIDTQIFWPQYMKDRIKATYAYFGASIVATAGAAVACLRSPAILRLMVPQSFLGIIALFGAMIGSGMLLRSIPYTEGIGVKQLAWLGHCGLIGGILAPLCVVGGPVVMRALWYTAGIVGGLSTVAVCAPSDQFLSWAGPCSIGLGVVAAASIGTMFLPATSALGMSIYSIAVYGGVVVFSGLMLYDTQKIIKMAEVYPMYGVQPYDPINASLTVYMDAVNLFIRMVMILNGSRRK